MPIDRDGKHWCNPAVETPSPVERKWTCPGCKQQWRYWPELATWAHTDVDLTPAEENATEGEL